MLRLFVALVYLGVVFGESSTQASTANGMTPTATTNATTAPVTTNATSPPSTTNATTLPVTTNATTLPVKTNATTLPVTTNATTLPVTTNATTLPVTTNATTLPVTTNATTLPVTTNTTTLPVTTNTTTLPVTTNTTTLPVTTNTTTLPVTANTTTLPVTANTTTLPVTTNTTNATTPIVTTNATTTPAPTTQTTARPPYGTYFIKNGDKYCLLAQFEAKFTINYMQYVKEGNKSNTTTKQGTVVLDSNAKVDVTGSCGMLILTWNKTRPHYTLSIEFGRPKKLQASGDSSFTWWLSRVSFLANLTDNPEFQNATVSVVNASYTLFQNNSIHGTNGSYYYCKKDTKFTLKAKSKDNQVQADFTDWKVEPFVEKSRETDFGSGEDCYQDNPTTSPTESKDSDIVPIAVGCALAGLVLIVLIAYVIGRRKSHRGYEKV